MRVGLAFVLSMVFVASALRAADMSAPSGPICRPPVIRALEDTMTGQPVIGVGIPGTATKDISIRPASGERLLKRLQTLGEAASTPDIHLIPYAVGSVWVLAPETREEFRLPNRDDPAVDYMVRRSATTLFLASLTPEEVRRLGSSSGLPAQELRGAARTALLRAVRPPLIISERREPVKLPPGEGADDSPPFRDLRRLETPLDPSTLRVFAKLGVRNAYFRMANDDYLSFPVVPPPNEMVLRGGEAGTNLGQFSDLEFPRLATVENQYKASDLSGGSLRQPIGLDGVHPVKEVLEAAARATGLTLHVVPTWEDVPVFLGSRSIPSGDALDALRLALEGTWRRIGQDYVLAWDLRGLAPLQRATIEAMQKVHERSDRMLARAQESLAWISIAKSTSFDAASPLSLTDDQRAVLLPHGPKEDAKISFEEMTAIQQGWVREQARTHPVTAQIENGVPFERDLSEDEVRTAAIDPNFDILVCVEEPSIGRLCLDPEFGKIEIPKLEDMRRLGMAGAAKLFPVTAEGMNAAESDDGSDEPETADETGDSGATPASALGPAAIPSQIRAVMVPPLGLATLNDLVSTMRRHGFNTLFYPALYDGYATFPTEAFPLHPALHGKDGLSAAVASTAGSDIRIVAYVNTLTWRGPDQPANWLRKHPDWLERDMLGRCRSDWLSDHPLKEDDRLLDVAIDRDYVRASDPAVATRLQTFLKALSAQTGLSGIAVSDWLPARLEDTGSDYRALDPETQPPLGFAPPDRYAFLRQTGLDPVDLTLWSEPPFLPRSMAPAHESAKPWDIRAKQWSEESDTLRPVDAPHPNVHLVSSLLRSARDLRPDWETYLFDTREQYRTLSGLGDLRPSQQKAGPEVTLPGHTIGMVLMAGDHADGVDIPLASKEVLKSIQAPDGLETVHQFMDAMRIGDWRNLKFHILGPPDAPEQRMPYDPPRIAVLNFQRMPEAIRDVLSVFRPPRPDELAPPKGTQAAQTK